MLVRKLLDWQDHRDFFTVNEREHVHDRTAARGARALRHFPDLEPVKPATVREAQQIVVCVGDKELVDPIVLFGSGGLLTTPATALGTILRQRLALDVAGVRERDHHVGWRDQVFGVKLSGIVLDRRATHILGTC